VAMLGTHEVFLLTCGHSDRVVTRLSFDRVILVIRSNE
jgi:hypothetical protein